MNADADSLMSFSWWSPQGAEGLLGWVDGEPLEDFGHAGFATEGQETRWLVKQAVPTEGYRYHPLDDSPELFRAFIDLPEGEEHYLRFATRYGLLGVGVPLTSRIGYGEAYATWLDAHRWLRSAWAVYRAARFGRVAELSSWIRADGKGAWMVGQPVPGHAVKFARLIASPEVFHTDTWRLVLGQDTPGAQLKLLAMTWVGRVVNRNLAGAPLTESAVTAAVEFDGAARRHTVRFHPHSLLGAMWLQFAKAIEGDLRYRQCRAASCKAWFLVSPEGLGRRRHALFCSDKCRLRHWRRRPGGAGAGARRRANTGGRSRRNDHGKQ